jgi:hypothetical protein
MYFQSFWNICDLVLLVTYAIYVPMSFKEDLSSSLAMKSIQCIIVLFTLIKATYFLRIFDGFSFLVQMLRSVFIDLKFFLFFFAIFLVSFSFFLRILLPNTDDSLE